MPTEIENRFYDLYLAFFNRAESERRWNVQKDIPWDQANPAVTDEIALIVESFMAVELYLPDYTSKILEIVRKSRGRAWFQANWGYEESKHSLVLEQWLLRSGKRSQKQIGEFAEQVLDKVWQLPFESPRQMMIYTTFQELSTGLNYRNLRRKAIEQNDKALATALSFVARDESAHYQFFQDGVKLHLKEDRDGTLQDINTVLAGFRMPAHDLIPDWEHRGQTIVGQGIFSDRIFFKDIMRPVLQVLGTSRQELQELRRRNPAFAAELTPQTEPAQSL
jgi:acyl-[acyl-carrier-protein] desaturase